MATNRRVGNQISKSYKRDAPEGIRYDTATYIGVVKDNKDPTRSGRIRVWIPDMGDSEDEEQSWRSLAYASPYFGATNVENSKSKDNKFEQVNHTYGMWMVTPDIGNQVLCTFVNGDPDRGYWFACVNPTLSHYMVPGLAAGNVVDDKTVDDSVKKGFKNDPKTQFLPVAEYNENAADAYTTDFYANPKPVHTAQTQILYEQGTDRDPVRGAVTSSSQRETPSHVFGISTPGRPLKNDPADDPNYEDKLAKGTQSDWNRVNSRRGGHTFVMDDGDVRGTDRLLRLRSSGGHTLLMNDTEDILYIINSKGSAWVELCKNGAINIFSNESITMRAKRDFNIHADNDVNIQAGNNFNMDATKGFFMTSQAGTISVTDNLLIHAGAALDQNASDMTIGAQTIGIGASGEVTIKGSAVALDGGGSYTATDYKPTKNPQTDTNPADPLYESVPNAFESIVPTNRVPAHEPWPRSKSASDEPAKIPVSDNACKPATQSAGNIQGIVPKGGDNEQLVESALMSSGYIRNTTMLAACMAQCKLESGNFRYLKELGQDSYFQKYEGRKDLGNTQPGDGLKYKGRGFIQITGRDIYNKAGSFLGLDLIGNPALGEDPKNAAKIVVFFFFNYKASRTASVDWNDCTAVTRIVNGGTNGLSERQRYFNEYKQKYGNTLPGASKTTGGEGVVTDGSGGVITDGSGNPVKSGSAPASNGDNGINAAKGKSIDNTCPNEKLNSTEAYIPPGGIGSGSPKLTQKQAQCLHAELGFMESGWDYTKVRKNRFGKYQIDAKYLADSTRGYIKPDAIGHYGATAAAESASWTGKDNIKDIETFLGNRNIQDKIQYEEFQTYYDKLIANQGVKPDDDVCTLAGMLLVAHQFRDADKAKKWRDTGEGKDDLDVEGWVYFNHGRYAIDSLGTFSNNTNTTADANSPATDNTTDINPSDVFTFTGGSGDRAHFDRLNATCKAAFLKMARDFKAKTGVKVTVASAQRSVEEQQALYERWKAAGGHLPTPNPVAGLNQPPPGNPGRPDSHNLGIALDCGSQASTIKNTVDLASYGLRWGGEFGDPVHIQWKAWAPGQPAPK